LNPVNVRGNVVELLQLDLHCQIDGSLGRQRFQTVDGLQPISQSEVVLVDGWHLIDCEDADFFQNLGQAMHSEGVCMQEDGGDNL
jgi:hypothetical protein